MREREMREMREICVRESEERCVCVGEREKEKEREIEREKERERERTRTFALREEPFNKSFIPITCSD